MRLPSIVSGFVDKGALRETVARVIKNLALPEKEKLPLVMCFYLTYGCNADFTCCKRRGSEHLFFGR
jgi:hypothetical protein